MPLTIKEVEKIAGLARIELTEKEKEHLAKELGSVLEYIDKLNEVNTDSIEPTAQITGLENVFRSDDNSIETGVWQDDHVTDKLIAEFPHKKENYLKVKKIFAKK